MYMVKQKLLYGILGLMSSYLASYFQPNPVPSWGFCPTHDGFFYANWTAKFFQNICPWVALAILTKELTHWFLTVWSLKLLQMRGFTFLSNKWEQLCIKTTYFLTFSITRPTSINVLNHRAITRYHYNLFMTKLPNKNFSISLNATF